MATLTRTVTGLIYSTKFDDITGWSEERDLRDYNNDTWTWLLSTIGLSATMYSSPTGLDALVRNQSGGTAHLISGRYLRLSRNITIPAGVTSVRMQVRHRWHSNGAGSYAWKGSRKIVLGAQTFLNQQASDAQDTWVFANSTVSTSAGAQALKVGTELYDNVDGDYFNIDYHHNYFDDLVVARGTTIIVTGLASGWKAKLYDASDTLIATATESGGTATINLTTQSYPITGTLKLTNGADVIQFTGDLINDHCGGDSWDYCSGEATLLIATNYYIINKTGGASPTQAVITFTLQGTGGTPLTGKTLTFTSSLGSINPANAVTDWNGQAQAILTSAATIGIAIVQGAWAGDPPNYPAMFETVEVSIHDAADDPDVDKDRQLFVQGIELTTVSEPIIKSEIGETVLTATIPGGSSEIVAFRDVAFYMTGILMFQGRIEIISKSMSTEVTKITARGFLRSLMRIHCGAETYTAQTLSYMINDILDTWVTTGKQVYTGSIADSLADITTTLELPDDISAYDVLTQIAKLAGCSVSVDENRFVNIR